MARRYGSFLLRRWRLPGGAERVEVEHIQTGERARLARRRPGVDRRPRGRAGRRASVRAHAS